MSGGVPQPSFDALEAQSQQSFAALLVSLYLVLLVFFIMLNAQAQVNAARQFEAISSLRSAFSSSKDRPYGPAESLPDGQDAQLMEEFYADLSAILVPLTELEGTHLVLHADHLVLTAPIAVFFAPLQAPPRMERMETWQRLAAFAESYKNRVAFHLSLAVGASPEPEGLRRDRAGAWARMMQSLGTDAAVIMTGEDPGLEEYIELRLSLSGGHRFRAAAP